MRLRERLSYKAGLARAWLTCVMWWAERFPSFPAIWHPVLFVITSTIRPTHQPVGVEGFVRSVFSAEERLEQTLQFVATIRERVSDVFVVLFENSILWEAEE